MKASGLSHDRCNDLDDHALRRSNFEIHDRETSEKDAPCLGWRRSKLTIVVDTNAGRQDVTSSLCQPRT